MNAPGYTTKFTVDRTPEEVYAAINDVRAWWAGDLKGNTNSVGDEFTYRYEDLHRSTQLITEMIPGKRIVWRVVHSELNFVADKTEWNGTEIIFDIRPKGDRTELEFTHVGLLPEGECFDSCSNAWDHYINHSLRKLLTMESTALRAIS